MTGFDNANAVAEMGRTFDRSFAEPLQMTDEEPLPLIAIRVAGEAMLLRLSQITGISRCPRIVPVRSGIPTLLGISRIRGSLIPVFCLAPILGLTAMQDEPQWLVTTGRESPIALAFSGFGGEVKVSLACVCEDKAAEPSRHIRQLARIGVDVRALIDVPSIVVAIQKEAGLFEHTSVEAAQGVTAVRK